MSTVRSWLVTALGAASLAGLAAADGDTALLGAALDDAAAINGGAVYVYVRGVTGGWSIQQILRPASPAVDALFGSALALKSNTAIIGARGDSDSRHGGAAYVFRRSGNAWTQTARIAPSDLSDYGAFGNSVAYDGVTIAVGMAPPGGESPGTGGLRLFEDQGTTFPQVAQLGDDGSNEFGASVAVRGNLLIAGAPEAQIDDGTSSGPIRQAGNAYLFQRVNGIWLMAAGLRGTGHDLFPITSGDYFGTSVALDGGTAFVGSVFDRTAATAAGAAFVFDLSGN